MGCWTPASSPYLAREEATIGGNRSLSRSAAATSVAVTAQKTMLFPTFRGPAAVLDPPCPVTSGSQPRVVGELRHGRRLPTPILLRSVPTDVALARKNVRIQSHFLSPHDTGPAATTEDHTGVIHRVSYVRYAEYRRDFYVLSRGFAVVSVRWICRVM
jgi:hypothetical protein